jgi:Flp pilus assembly protein TadB
LLAVAVAIGVAAGAHPVALAIAVLAFLRPVWFLVAVAGWAVYRRWSKRAVHGPREEALFLEGLAAELRGGASLRSAVADAADRTEIDLAVPVRMAKAGRPMEDIARPLGERLPVNGAVAGPALRLAAAAGASVAPLFDALALRAAEAADEERESRVLTAQARLSAWLVGGAPAAVAAGIFAFRGFSFGDGSLAVAIAVVGFGLQAIGGLVVWRMVRASRW